MNEAFVQKLIAKQKFDAYVYSAEIFERRIHEEKFRAGELNTSFCYLELSFEHFTLPETSPEIVEKVWHHLLQILPNCLRGSDIRGWMRDHSGLAILFLDCTELALNVFFQRLRQHMAEVGLDIALNHRNIILRNSYTFSPSTEVPV